MSLPSATLDPLVSPHFSCSPPPTEHSNLLCVCSQQENQGPEISAKFGTEHTKPEEFSVIATNQNTLESPPRETQVTDVLGKH